MPEAPKPDPENEANKNPEEGKGSTESQESSGQSMIDTIKTWTMVALTGVFVILYVLALFGVINPNPNNSLLTRLEPMLFVIIGYYFGRVPGQENEQTLKDEVDRQTDRADAAENEKTGALEESAGLKKTLDSAKAVLSSAAPSTPPDALAPTLSGGGSDLVNADQMRQTVAAALKVLDS